MAETGHAKNLEHFTQMIAFVTGYGAAYAPTNPALAVAALQTKLNAADFAMDDVTTELMPWKVAVNERQDAFDGIRRLTTRVLNAFAVSGAPESAVDDLKTYKRKIDGARATALADDPDTPDEDESQGNSVSQQSYTQLVEHLDNIIAILQNYPIYAPNESELATGSLVDLSDNLKAANAGVMNAVVPLSNARIARNDVMYADDTGLFDIAAMVKKYVKAAFGADSPQFAQISGLTFTRPR